MTVKVTDIKCHAMVTFNGKIPTSMNVIFIFAKILIVFTKVTSRHRQRNGQPSDYRSKHNTASVEKTSH